MFSGIFIHDSLSDWEENPVITTMDSIAAPVNDIQFPTVTVCHDEDKPPDNWAPLELFLNNFAFQCKEFEDYPINLPICNDTIKIRNEFKFLIELISKRMNKMMLDENLQDLSLLEDENDLMEKIAVALTDGDLDKESLYNLPNQYFGVEMRERDIKLVLKALINETEYFDYSFFGYYSYYEEKVNCSSLQCQQNLETVLSVASTLHDVTDGYGFLFGSFLAEFIPQLADEFNPNSYFYHKMKYICHFDMGQEKIHDFLVSLSRYFGLKQSEAVSLYDIPAILNIPTELKYGELKMPQSFISTLCNTEG